METFHVAGILDLGKYDYNARFMISDLEVVQDLGRLKRNVNGYRMRIKDSNAAPDIAARLQDDLGFEFGLQDWTKASGNMFKAVAFEKLVLFFLMCIILVAAFMNVSSTLYLNVMRRYAQVSILKTLGVRRKSIVSFFLAKGLLLAGVGLSLGLILGLLFCYLFEIVQKVYPIMPAEVYNVTFIASELYWSDVLGIIVATIVISIIATLAPALRGSKLPPVEGLKYE